MSSLFDSISLIFCLFPFHPQLVFRLLFTLNATQVKPKMVFAVLMSFIHVCSFPFSLDPYDSLSLHSFALLFVCHNELNATQVKPKMVMTVFAVLMSRDFQPNMDSKK